MAEQDDKQKPLPQDDRASLDNNDQGDSDPEEQFPEALIAAFKTLVDKVGTRDLILRRLQSKDVWKQRLMYRGYQRLVDGGNCGFDIAGEGGGVLATGVGDDGTELDFRNIENIYFAYGQIIISALTGSKPTCRFTADNLSQPDDLISAENADYARQFIERNNNITEINQEAVRYLYTDGVFYYHSCWDEDEERERVHTYGALEVKRAITGKCLKDSPFLQLALEKDKNIWKEMFPEVADKITGSNAGASQNQFDRIARISVNAGMGATLCTGDSFAHLATGQMTWIRPSFYNEVNEEQQKLLKQYFPNGVKLTFVGTTFCEAVEESMDESWTEVFANPGDGAHRPSIGTPLVPIQERLNDLLDILYATFDHGIPWRWVSTEIDLNAIGDQENAPGMTGQVKTSGNKALADYFFVETQLDVPASMITQIRALENEVAQLMVGAFPALFGGTDLGANAAVGTTTIQRDQALGRLGMIWRFIKAGYASCIEQAVILMAEHRSGNLQTEMPGTALTDSTAIEIDFDALNKGRFAAHTDSDDNFPESWTQKKSTFILILTAAEKNPNGFAASIMKDASNMAYAKYVIGLPDITVPEEVSRNKQLTEIGLLLKQQPLPNPMHDELTQQIAQQKAQGIDVSQLEQQLQNIPPMVSSVPIDPVWDNDAVEKQEVGDWVNSREGQKAKRKNPMGFQNVSLHGQEHAASLTGKTPPPVPQPKEAISVTIPLDKMPSKVQSEILTKLGIPVDEGTFDKQDTQDAQLEIAKKTISHPAARAAMAGPPRRLVPNAG